MSAVEIDELIAVHSRVNSLIEDKQKAAAGG